MQRAATLQTVARRHATSAHARAFSSSVRCAEEDSKRPGDNPTPARRVPMASSLGDIALPNGKSRINPGPATFTNYQPNLTWASQVPVNDAGGPSLSQRQAQRRLQSLGSAENAANPSELSATPPILDVPTQSILTPEEKRAEITARWRAQAEKAAPKRRNANEARSILTPEEKRAEITTRWKTRGIELDEAIKEKKKADIEAQARAKERKEKLRQQNDERRKVEWERLQTTQMEQAKEDRREQETLMKSAPKSLSLPSIVTPRVAREELENLVAMHTPPTEQADSDATTAPVTQAALPTPLKPEQLESVLAARVQSLKERAGDYSAYLPSHFGVGRAPGQERSLGPVAYAQLALARTRGASLDKRQGVVKIVERFTTSKDTRSDP